MPNVPFSTPIPIAVQPPQCALPYSLPMGVTMKQEQRSFDDDTPKRKRKRTDESTYLRLSRDDLLKFSSKEYEDYVKNLAKEKPLTAAEAKDVKRQRRLIKNREYAQTSRNKKKELVGHMESQLDQLNAENGELRDRVETLDNKVKQLEDMNSYLSEENRQLKETIVTLTQYEHSAPQLPESPSETSTPPPTPSSSTEEEDVDHFLAIGISDSEETSSPSSPPVESDRMSLFDDDTVFGEELNDSFSTDSFSTPSFSTPSFSNWSEPVFGNMLTMFAVFLCFALFVPNIDNNNTYPLTYPEPAQISKSVVNEPLATSFSKNNPNTGRELFSVDGEHEPSDLVDSGEFNSSFTCPAPLSMDDVLLDEMDFKSSSKSNDGIFYEQKTHARSPDIQENYSPYNYNSSIMKDTNEYVTVSYPLVRTLFVES